MDIPHIQYEYAFPVGIASLVAFLFSFCVVYLVLVPQLRRAQAGRTDLEDQLATLLSGLQSKNTDLKVKTWTVRSQSVYGPLHKDWEREYHKARRSAEEARHRLIEEQNAKLASIKSSEIITEQAESIFSALLGTQRAAS